MLKLLTTKLLDAGYSERMAPIILATALHETGNFTSDLFLRSNNPWGMKHPAVRKTTSLGPNGRLGYATYKTLEDAVQDYIYYLDALGYQKEYADVRSYVAEMKKKSYFEDSYVNYYAGAQKWFNTIQISG